MNGVLKVLLDIFRQPSVIVALISLIGLILQRKSATDVMKGTIRTFVGFLVLASGVGVVTNALTPPLGICSSMPSISRALFPITRP